MSLNIRSQPSQGGINIKFQTIVVVDSDSALFQASLNAILDTVAQHVNPQGGKFLSDVQYQTSGQMPNVEYSALVIVGEWNPA